MEEILNLLKSEFSDFDFSKIFFPKTKEYNKYFAMTKKNLCFVIYRNSGSHIFCAELEKLVDDGILKLEFDFLSKNSDDLIFKIKKFISKEY